MTKSEYQERELDLLKKEAKKRSLKLNGFMITMISLLVLTLITGFSTFKTHGEKIIENKMGIINIENTSEATIENKARVISDKAIEIIKIDFNSRMDDKVDKSAFEILVDDIKYIRNKLDNK